MNKERELLLVALDFLNPSRWLDPADQHVLNILTRDIEEILAQPEHIPDEREPLDDREISHGFRISKKAIHAESFWMGVRFAEKAHGIGVE